MNETDELNDRNHELAETSKELMGLQRELERQRTINKTIAHDIQKGIDNIQLLCKSCNRKKSTQTIDYRRKIQHE